MRPIRLMIRWAAMGMTIALLGCDESPSLPSDLPEKPATVEQVEPPTPPPNPDRLGVHGGSRYPFADGRGHVEWVARQGRLYFLDARDQPWGPVERAVLHAATPTGPRLITLLPCDDQEFAGACLRAPENWLGPDTPPTRLVRFELDGQAHRVRLSAEPIDR